MPFGRSKGVRINDLAIASPDLNNCIGWDSRGNIIARESPALFTAGDALNTRLSNVCFGRQCVLLPQPPDIDSSA